VCSVVARLPTVDTKRGLRNSDLEPTKAQSTNADRFARGLPPMKPDKLFSPTRVARWQTPPAPSGLTYGNLAIYCADRSKILCYVQPDAQKCGPQSTAQLFSYRTSFPFKHPAGSTLSFGAVGPPAGRFLYLYYDPKHPLSSDSDNFAGIGITKFHSAPGSDPGGPHNTQETSVFTLDLDNHHFINVLWINPGSSTPLPLTLELLPEGPFYDLYFTGDPTLFEQSGSTPAILRFVPPMM